MYKIIITAISIMLACLSPALAQDSIRAARELESQLENYRKSPEDRQKIKALLQKEEERKSKGQDSLATGNLDFLKELEGKYPYEIKLFENAVFSKRLKKLLGSRCRFLINNFDVQIPIEIADGIFIAFACRAHDCGTTDFMIVYDFSRDALSAGIRENEQAKVYSENGEILAKIAEWANLKQ